MPRKDLIQVRRDNSANWLSVNPILASGEIGFELDTNKMKVGDGTRPWSLLPYGNGALTISDTAPPYPNTGDQWFESDTGRLFVYYDSFWVEALGGTTGAPGPTGPTGPPNGPTGPTGPQGPTGPPFAGQLDGGFFDSNYGGISPLDAGGIV